MTLSDTPDQDGVSKRISFLLRDGRTLFLKASITEAPSVGRGGPRPKPPLFLEFALDSGEFVSISSETDFIATAPSVGTGGNPA